MSFTLERLRTEWLALAARDKADGVPSFGVQRFEADADERLGRLAATLADGTWAPDQLTEWPLMIGAKRRMLQVPGVEDRIVARVILDLVTPLIDPWLGLGACAYRQGIGVVDAVQRIAAWREEGYRWIVRTDVTDCFPNIPADLAWRRFLALVPEGQLSETAAKFANRATWTQQGVLIRAGGIPQGCPLSPTLANLVLSDVDTELLDAGFPVVRYGDDLAIAAMTEIDASEALRVASIAVGRLGMNLGAKKTMTTTFDEGFTYLGEDFGPKYPPLITGHRVEEPDDKVIYAGPQGGRIRVAAGRVLVTSKNDTVLLDVPTGQVRRIVVFGSVGLTAGARAWALGNDVEVVFASRSGSFQGTLHSHSDAWRPARLKAQIAAQSLDRRMPIARAAIQAKIRNQQTVLRHFNRRDTREEVRDAIGQLTEVARMTEAATTAEELMGLEGAAARFYFPCFGALMPELLRFTLRSRQPPEDPANSALSYLYAILLGECVTALHAAGLDPGLGLLHSDQGNRPSLALDLMEEFRPLIVDQVVLESARQNRFLATHGVREPGRGVRLTKAGKEALTLAYEQRMNRKINGALRDFAGTYRRHLYRQASRLRGAIMDPAYQWTGLSWR